MSKTATDIYNEAIRNIWKAYEPEIERSMRSLVTTGTAAHLYAPYDDADGLTVEKLREAKRQLLRTDVQKYRYIWPMPKFTMESRHIDKEIIDTLLKKGETPVTTKKQKPEKFNTIGVRSISQGINSGIASYRVHPGAKVYLGQELVIDEGTGPCVVVVARIDKEPVAGTYAYITKKAVAL